MKKGRGAAVRDQDCANCCSVMGREAAGGGCSGAPEKEREGQGRMLFRFFRGLSMLAMFYRL